MNRKPYKKAYKATFIIDTRQTTESTEIIIESLKETIKAVDGEVSKVEDIGVRDFSRCTDATFTLGRYLQFDLQGTPQTPAALQQKFRLNKVVNRVLIEAV